LRRQHKIRSPLTAVCYILAIESLKAYMHHLVFWSALTGKTEYRQAFPVAIEATVCPYLGREGTKHHDLFCQRSQ
jgi:hypothetical protein